MRCIAATKCPSPRPSDRFGARKAKPPGARMPRHSPPVQSRRDGTENRKLPLHLPRMKKCRLNTPASHLPARPSPRFPEWPSGALHRLSRGQGSSPGPPVPPAGTALRRNRVHPPGPVEPAPQGRTELFRVAAGDNGVSHAQTLQIGQKDRGAPPHHFVRPQKALSAQKRRNLCGLSAGSGTEVENFFARLRVKTVTADAAEGSCE